MFIIYYLYLTHDSNQNFIKYIKDTFLVLFSFIFFSIPIIFIILNSEPDWLIRVGLFELDIDKKKMNQSVHIIWYRMENQTKVSICLFINN